MGVLAGPFINAVGIVAGVVAGRLVGVTVGGETRRVLLRVLGIVVVLLGAKMAWALPDPSNTLMSLMIGAWAGTRLGLGGRLRAWSEKVRGERLPEVVGPMITASLVFNVGAMAVMGALQAGTGGRPVVLETKAVLDGVTAMMLASVQGWGVAGAAVVTLVYEGALAMGAQALRGWVHGAPMANVETVGGLMIVAIGINFVSDRETIAVADLLPSLVVSALLSGLGFVAGLKVL